MNRKFKKLLASLLVTSLVFVQPLAVLAADTQEHPATEASDISISDSDTTINDDTSIDNDDISIGSDETSDSDTDALGDEEDISIISEETSIDETNASTKADDSASDTDTSGNEDASLDASDNDEDNFIGTHEEWYYFDSNVAPHNGWLKYKDKWYYRILNMVGCMQMTSFR